MFNAVAKRLAYSSTCRGFEPSYLYGVQAVVQGLSVCARDMYMNKQYSYIVSYRGNLEVGQCFI